jgi:hypothetical protein
MDGTAKAQVSAAGAGTKVGPARPKHVEMLQQLDELSYSIEHLERTVKNLISSEKDPYNDEIPVPSFESVPLAQAPHIVMDKIENLKRRVSLIDETLANDLLY